MFWITFDHGFIVRNGWKAKQDSYNGGIRIQYQDPKSILFDAVLNGNISKVKALISDGMDSNTVFHSPVRWEGATILCIAACEGHSEIVKYLVESGTSINFGDPCKGRNSLHWACMGNQYSIAKYLLQNGANVNHIDKDKVTPIIQATICQNVHLVQLLIQYGADANLVDHLQCSPLHYACMYRNPDLVKIIVKGGCILNNRSALAKGTPLSNIINNDLSSCLLMLEAGYNLNEDVWFKERKKTNNSQLIQTLLNYQTNIKPLKTICRTVVRKMLKSVKIEGNINSLEIPNDLKSFLKMNEW